MHETTTKTAYTGAFTSFIMGRIADMFTNINWADVASVVCIIIGLATFLITRKKTLNSENSNLRTN